MTNEVHSRVQLENRVVVNPFKTRVCERVSGSPPPPLSRVAQPVSMNTRPVRTTWRALLVSYVYCGLCDDWRCSPRPNRGTTRLVKSAQKSRIGPRVSKSRDAPQVSPAMEVIGKQQVAETRFFPVWRRLPVGTYPPTRVTRDSIAQAFEIHPRSRIAACGAAGRTMS